VRYLAPKDSDRGGTWIAVNEYGVAMCLLNGNGVAVSALSRGLLIPELIWARSADDAAFLLRQTDLRQYAPFTIVFLAPGQSALVAAWDGVRLSFGENSGPLISSSYDLDGVRRSRLNEFARRVAPAEPLDPAQLYWFHASHGAGPDAYSTCMHRDDAETVSFSWVVVSAGSIRFLYSPSAPCQCSPSQQHVLPRAA
jgi:hypothetical protein